MEKSIEKGMANVCFAFEVLEGVTTEHMREKKVKAGFKYVGTLMIFHIKTDSKFTCEARLVTFGHNTAPPLSIPY